MAQGKALRGVWVHEHSTDTACLGSRREPVSESQSMLHTRGTRAGDLRRQDVCTVTGRSHFMRMAMHH